MVVAKYLKTIRQVGRFVLHGESIGGLSACHVAHRLGLGQVDLLICDRTFASLDAVAARLLGAWAGYGIRFLTWWQTDVVADYLASPCPKVLLQDPADEIIAHCASLKAGVATQVRHASFYTQQTHTPSPPPCRSLPLTPFFLPPLSIHLSIHIGVFG